MNSPTTARAAVFSGHGEPLRLEEFPVPAPGRGEILAEVTCSTVCGSDVHTWASHRKEPTPCVLGHEIVGRIAAFGDQAPGADLRGDPLKEGDRITWTLGASCGDCFFCRHDLPQKCERLFKYGHARIAPGSEFNGGFAKYCLLVPGTGVIRLPDTLADHIAAPANCAVATAAATTRMLAPLEGATVAVVGCGVLGLFACALARHQGAVHVIGCDLVREQEPLARSFGATDFCPPDELAEKCSQSTAGRGADHAIEFSGSSAGVTTALDCLRTGGSAVIAGTTLPVAPVPLDPNRFVRRMLTVRGLHNYTPGDLVAAVDFLASAGDRFPFEALAGATFPLSEINQAFRNAATQSGTRVAVVP